ncbi:MAG: nucleotidyltransferase domain-containing protein [Anaerolineae bacterium]
MIEARYFDVLRQIHARLKDSPIPWVITGSLGMALQGVDVAVHDIDLQTNAEGAYAIERCFPEYVVQPVRFSASERIRSHFGALEIGGIRVEIMGDVQKRLDDKTWEEPVSVERYRRWVEACGMRLPVLSLEYECQAYLQLGRKDKAEVLKKWLAEHREEEGFSTGITGNTGNEQ